MSSPRSAPVEKRSITIRGHRTSVSLEAPFWAALKEKATADGRSLSALIAEIDDGNDGNLSSALRLHVVEWLQARIDGQKPISG